ncbi:putative inner membrane transport protein [Escherichia coli]|uniref:Putative inner membrane transport protein n=1 Tax=Escherichia coli TaxID=562 RepID=A0A376TWB9_ECOLX|nr:putative inner membrane transport protein [Escherichia coli]
MHSGGDLFTRREIVIQNFDRHGADQLLVVAALGVSMVGMWHLYNVGSLPPLGLLVKNAIITLPFTLTSILFIRR